MSFMKLENFYNCDFIELERRETVGKMWLLRNRREKVPLLLELQHRVRSQFCTLQVVCPRTVMKENWYSGCKLEPEHATDEHIFRTL